MKTLVVIWVYLLIAFARNEHKKELWESFWWFDAIVWIIIWGVTLFTCIQHLS